MMKFKSNFNKMKWTFSNSGINKVAMVKNALLPMSLYSLICVNEIIRYHLHIVDRSTMCKWNHKVSFTHSRHEWCNLTNFYLAFFLLMSLLENATSPWGQSWERVLHKHSCIHHSTCAFGTRAVICMHLCLCKTLSQDCPHGEIRHLQMTQYSRIELLPKREWQKV